MLSYSHPKQIRQLTHLGSYNAIVVGLQLSNINFLAILNRLESQAQ